MNYIINCFCYFDRYFIYFYFVNLLLSILPLPTGSGIPPPHGHGWHNSAFEAQGTARD